MVTLGVVAVTKPGQIGGPRRLGSMATMGTPGTWTPSPDMVNLPRMMDMMMIFLAKNLSITSTVIITETHLGWRRVTTTTVQVVGLMGATQKTVTHGIITMIVMEDPKGMTITHLHHPQMDNFEKMIAMESCILTTDETDPSMTIAMIAPLMIGTATPMMMAMVVLLQTADLNLILMTGTVLVFS